MAGDNLSILLFFVTCAVAFGIEAVKAETAIRRASFATLAAMCLLTGIFWVQLKTVWPALSHQVERVATNPVSWFVIIIFLLAVFAFHRPKSKRPDDPQASKTNQNQKTPLATDIVFKRVGDREILENAADYLFWLRRSTATIHAEKLLVPFVGKWIKISGTISDVQDEYATIEFYDPLTPLVPNRAHLWFDESWKDRFHILDRELVISAIGKIVQVNQRSITVHNSELSDS